jgi:hypothetical protein
MYEPGSGQGLLADFQPMTNFRAKRQWATFSREDACNFALNIYDDGNTLSIGKMATDLCVTFHVAWRCCAVGSLMYRLPRRAWWLPWKLPRSLPLITWLHPTPSLLLLRFQKP